MVLRGAGPQDDMMDWIEMLDMMGVGVGEKELALALMTTTSSSV